MEVQRTRFAAQMNEMRQQSMELNPDNFHEVLKSLGPQPMRRKSGAASSTNLRGSNSYAVEKPSTKP